jgi:hypothetical protein
MRVLLQIALCGILAGSGAMAQRGGGGGMRGGGGMGGGGFRGGGGMGGGGFRGGMGGGGFRGGMGGGGFRGGMGGGGFRGGFNGGFHGGFNNGFNKFRFNNFRFNRFGFNNRFFNNGFGVGFFPGWGWGGGWGYWPGSDWYCDSYLGCGDGGYGFGYGEPAGYGGAPAYSAQPNVTIINPPQQAPAAYPVYVERANPVMREYDQYGQETSRGSSAVTPSTPPVYLIAMKDHVIRAAAAYWVDGVTLHFVTLEHEERRVPLDTVDRGLSLQLNRERHVVFALPQ